MKKRINLISELLAAGFFTLMFVIDFFPNIGIPMNVVIIGVVICIVLALITRQKGEAVFRSSKQELMFTIFSGIYIFSILLILTLLGGSSQVGLSLTNTMLWAFYVIGVLFSYTKYKKELKQTRTKVTEVYSK